MIKIISIIAVALAVSPAYALQKIAVKNGHTVAVTISEHETSRLSIEQGRIVKAWGMEANLTVIPDVPSGELFFIPKDNADKTFSFFVRDSDGGTYTIAATQKSIPSETIILETSFTKKKPVSKSDQKLKDLPYVLRVKHLITAMAQNNTEHDGFYDVVHGLKDYVNLWREVSIMLKSQYHQEGLTGETYALVNTTEAEMVLAETEFLNFGRAVVAVAIDNMTLLPSQSTNVYIVRKEGVL
tara:strand:+ start:819 stop:1541 length:723 start_codon:yes stop_codon:yes gene_type:complete